MLDSASINENLISFSLVSALTFDEISKTTSLSPTLTGGINS